MKFDKNFNVIKNLFDDDGNIIESFRIPIFIWSNEMDNGALEQAYNLARLPFAFHNIGLMPDGHYGYGMPIGGVFASDGYIIPNAVGKDIGCGMIALRTSLFVGSMNKTLCKKIMSDIRKLIPIGVGGKRSKKEKIEDKYYPNLKKLPMINFPLSNSLVIDEDFENTDRQIGTLGAGNHFIEIQEGDDGYIWIMIHSGSRNLGNKVCTAYDKIAKNLNEQWYSIVPREHQLSFLPFNHDLGQMYFYEMQYCCEYALCNRQMMMDKVMEAFLNHVDVEFATTFKNTNINIHHNYAALENHFGRNVLVHRKGATRAYENEYGIIPGSQGSSSYIVVGKGNTKSFKSCSHGAGRIMGRKEAQRKLKLKDEIKKLDDQGIVHSIRTVNDLDEASGAYKDISQVMKNQEDLVDIVVELKPIAVLKG